MARPHVLGVMAHAPRAAQDEAMAMAMAMAMAAAIAMAAAMAMTAAMAMAAAMVMAAAVAVAKVRTATIHADQRNTIARKSGAPKVNKSTKDAKTQCDNATMPPTPIGARTAIDG